MQGFTISLDDRQAHLVDGLIVERRRANRSGAVRDLYRAEIELHQRHRPANDGDARGAAVAAHLHVRPAH